MFMSSSMSYKGGKGGANHPSTINIDMNIPTIIQVLTVVAPDATVIYQQVYVNNDYAATADRDRQANLHKNLLLNGGMICLNQF